MLIRDTRKDKTYFDKFIAYQDARIKKFENAVYLAEKNDSPNINGIISTYNSLFKFKMHRLISMYSRGDSNSDIKEYFKELYHSFLKASEFSYSDIVWFVSIASLYNENLPDIIARIKLLGKADKFLLFLLKDTEWECSKDTFQKYKNLLGLTQVNSKSEIEKYIDDWYSSNEDAYWYDSHIKDSDTYFGYWCFEALAVIKLYEIVPFKNKIFLPYDIV